MNYENYDPCYPDQPVVDLYLPIWAKLPAFRAKPAFIWAEDGSAGVKNCSTLTYEHLNASVQSISLKLLVALRRRDIVVVLCSPGLELVEIIFACQRAGLVAVPISPADPSFANNHHHLVRVLSQTKPKAAIAHSNYIQRIRQVVSSSPSSNKQLYELVQKLTWIATEDLADKKVDMPRNLSSSYHGCKADDDYLIQYTSGATGAPKPVLVSAGSAAHNVRAARKAYDLHPNSVIVSWLPQYHDCGLMFLLLTIVSGATCVLTSPHAFINRPRVWLELITAYRATCTPVPSFTLPLVVKRGEIHKGSLHIDMSTMKNLIIINEPIYNASVQEFIQIFRPFGLNPSAISPSYGLAENCTFVSTAWRRGNYSSPPVYRKLLPSARLTSYDKDEEEEIKILVVKEDTEEIVEDGVEGEIWVSSPSNASGYLGHPSLTHQVFNGRLKNRLSRCFVRTGDRGIVMGEERYLYVTGRCVDIIKLPSGQELHPHYIETAAYRSCPELLRGGCLAAFGFLDTIAVVAEMQRGEVKAMTQQKLCEAMRNSVLKEESIEVGLVVLVKSGNLPKTTSGKIQRWAAKNKLIGEKMSVLTQMKLDKNNNSLASMKTLTNASKEGKGGVDGKEGKMVAQPSQGSFDLSLSSPQANLSLLSSL